MLNKQKSFFNNLLGDWILTKNIYLINKKKVYSQQESINIMHKVIDKKNNQYIITNNKLFNNKNNLIQINQKNIIKNYNRYNNTYITQYINEEKVIIKTKYDNIEYEEDIYSINNNLKISIGILFKNNQCKCITFCSYIKKI